MCTTPSHLLSCALQDEQTHNAFIRLDIDRLQEPMFSMERAATLLLWSALVYRVEADRGGSTRLGNDLLGLLRATSTDPEAALPAAREMHGCTQHRVLYCAATDVKAIVAWGPRTVVITFRGTFSAKNAKLDLRLARRLLPGAAPEVAELPACTVGCMPRKREGRVLVHGGFLEAWEGGGFSEQARFSCVLPAWSPGYHKQEAWCGCCRPAARLGNAASRMSLDTCPWVPAGGCARQGGAGRH
jgi:hypothetical protein